MGDRVGNTVVAIRLASVTAGLPTGPTQIFPTAFITVTIRFTVIAGGHTIDRGLTANHLRRTATHAAGQQHRGGRKKQPIGTHGQDPLNADHEVLEPEPHPCRLSRSPPVCRWYRRNRLQIVRNLHSWNRRFSRLDSFALQIPPNRIKLPSGSHRA